MPGTGLGLATNRGGLGLGVVDRETGGLLGGRGVELDGNGNVKTDENKTTSIPGVCAAGDMSRGQSLVVWAMAEGREAARGIDLFLMGKTSLPRSVSTMS